ncbi:MAG TPA: single-stranded DNA-binding protein [Micromonosporaceae bacterium]|nr:single-stranded DNA-binding protein [Micromonosporaceae bacterium]
MFDTYVTIVGNVLTAPEWKRTSNAGVLVARFKVASTARRLDREKGQWVDGNSFRVRVNCWRRLAEGVSSSVMTGDPVVVVGRLYTRDWMDAENNHRTLYELDAVAVGHDLSRGRGKFARNKPAGATNAIEDGEADGVVQGAATETLAAHDAPVRYGEHGIPADEDPGFSSDPFAPAVAYDPFAPARAEGGEVLAAELVEEDGDDGLAPLVDGDDADELGDAVPGDGAEAADPAESAAPGRRRGRGRSPVSA